MSELWERTARDASCKSGRGNETEARFFRRTETDIVYLVLKLQRERALVALLAHLSALRLESLV